MFIAPYNLMKRFISYNMNLMNKPFLGDLINSLLGTGEGVGQAQEWGHKAMDVGKPHGVTGPYGSTSFDQETGMSLQLSPEQQEQIGMFTSLLNFFNVMFTSILHYGFSVTRHRTTFY